jgi:glycosyltransferase involved in cell wall biosynthesis
MPNIRHWTINSRNRKALKAKGVDADIIHDSMDFDERLAPESYQRLRAELRNKHDIKPDDIVLLVGARIVPNKRIEIAGKLTAILHDRRQDIVGKEMYNGETFTGQGRVVLVLAGRPEVAFLDYQQKLFDLFDTMNIDWMYVGDEVRPLRSEEQGFYALYPDMYAIADFVLYPTGWEGFGNQLLEAFAAGLPAAVFEYPVYKEDIGPRGVQIVSLGDTAEEGPDGLMQLPQETLGRAASEMMDILTSPDKYREIVENNIAVGRRNFSFDVLRAHLNDALSWAQSFKA